MSVGQNCQFFLLEKQNSLNLKKFQRSGNYDVHMRIYENFLTVLLFQLNSALKIKSVSPFTSKST